MSYQLAKGSNVAISFVQSTNHVQTGGATITVSTTASGTGNLLVIAASFYSGGPITGITDNVGNMYIQVPGVYVVGPSVNETVDVWCCVSSLSGATSITVTFTSAIVKGMAVFFEYTDPGHTFSVDAGSHGVNATPSVTTTNSGDVLVACATTDNGVNSVNSPWTHFVAPLFGVGAADYITSSTGVYPTEFNTNGGNVVFGIAAFSPSAGPSRKKESMLLVF